MKHLCSKKTIIQYLFRSSFLFFILFISGTKAFAQPPNDDPCNAILLTPTTTCTYQNFTTAAATGSVGVPAPGCANYVAGDVWFKVVVPCTGSLNFDSQTGVITDGGMAIYSGTCSNLTLITCDDDGSSNGLMPAINATGLTTGDTIWVRFWEYGDDNPGTFGLCASIPPPPGPGGSCSSAQPFCTGTVYNFPNNTNVPQLGGGGIYGCLGSTPNPVFYYMQIQDPGSLDIHIVQTNAAGNLIDVDFACWGPFPDLASSCGGLTAANNISCSYSTAGDETAHIPNAQVGEFYVLLLTNYSNQPGNITFQQSGGAASTSCAVICNINASNDGPVCPGETFNLNSNLPAGLPGAVYSWTGPNCFASNSQNPTNVTPPQTPGTYTYTVTATTPSGSVCSTTTTVTVGGLSGSSAAQTATTCPGVNDGVITVTPPTGAGPFTYTLNIGLATEVIQPGNPIFTGLAPGNYTITVANSIGCAQTLPIVVTAGPAITSTAVRTLTSCTGVSDGTITIAAPATGGPFTYTLNPGLPTEINQNNNPVFTGLATGTYTLQFTTAAGCVGTVPSQTVTAGPSPSTTAAPAPTTCPALNDGTITITAPASGGPFTYTLNPGLPTEVNQNNNPVFINLAVGTYTLQFTTAVGCIGTVPSQTINVGPTPSTTAAPTATTCPELNDGVITITAPATGGPFTYTLNPGLPTQIVQNNNPVFTNLPAGTYTLSFTTAAGCVGNVPSQTINVGPSPTATATPTATSCPTVNDGSITVVPPVTGGPFIYTLNPGLPTQVVQNNNPTFTNLAPGTYTISFTNAAGCNGTVSPNPVVAPGAVITDNPPTITNPPCANINDGVITIVPSVAGTYTYILNPGLPSQINNGNNPTFTNLAPGNYTYSFTSAIGCVGTGNTTLTTHSPLAISIILTQPLCNGNANGSITLSASGGVAPYQYALSPFTTYQGGTFNGLIAGTYTFRVKDDVGCTKDTTVTLGEPTLLTASSTSVAGTCNGNDGQITITANGGTPAYTYSIDNGVTFQSSNIFVVSGGNYPDIRVKDNNNCIANTGVNVVLIDNMVITPANDTTICVGQSVALQPQLSTEASIFQWSTIPDSSLVSTLNDATIKNAIATPADTTTYVLHAIWGVCSRNDTITVNILHKPVPYAGLDTTVCSDRTTAVLYGSATNLSGTVNYAWSDTTNLQTPHNDVTIATPTLTETFTLTVTDNYGCNFSVTDDVTVFVRDPVPAFAGNDTIAVINEPHQLLGSGGVAYDWLPAYPLNLASIANPLATLDHDQQFTLTVTDDIGCIGHDTMFVRVYPGPAYHVPNAFSPNGDGLNDIFRVVPAGISNTEWFRVFNRFGQLVFETNQWLKGWDGTFKGKKQPMGNYVWMLKGTDKNGKVIEMKGTVLLIQ